MANISWEKLAVNVIHYYHTENGGKTHMNIYILKTVFYGES